MTWFRLSPHHLVDALTHTVSLTVTKFGEWACPSVWNSVPSDIQHVADTAIVRRRLKTHLFHLYFNTY